MTMLTKDVIAYLDSDKNTWGLDAIATHGFLSAVACGPQFDEWLNVLFDDQLKQVSPAALDGIRQWQSEIKIELENEEKLDPPIDMSGEDPVDDEDSDLSVWCLGFVDALYANEQSDWFEQEEEVSELVLPMIVYSGIEDGDEALETMRSNDQLLDEMAAMIPGNLGELYLIFNPEPGRESTS